MKKLIKCEKQGAPDVNSFVYNALADVAFELTQAGYEVSEENFQDAVDRFMDKFFDQTDMENIR